MSTQKTAPRAQKATKKPFFTEKLVKDIKFGATAFAVLMLILTHYAWIMRQLIIRPNLTVVKIGSFFVVFMITSCALLYLLMTVVYGKVYAEELAQEKREKADKEQKKAQ